MLQAISNSFPEFLPYALFCYSKPCPLYAADLEIMPMTAVQQGDP